MRQPLNSPGRRPLQVTAAEFARRHGQVQTTHLNFESRFHSLLPCFLGALFACLFLLFGSFRWEMADQSEVAEMIGQYG